MNGTKLLGTVTWGRDAGEQGRHLLRPVSGDPAADRREKEPQSGVGDGVPDEGPGLGGEDIEPAHRVDGVGAAVVPVALAPDRAELAVGDESGSAAVPAFGVGAEDEHLVRRESGDVMSMDPLSTQRTLRRGAGRKGRG